jgi:hypothetical protein
MADWLLAAALVIAAGGLLLAWWVTRSKPSSTPAVCAWCQWRAGNDCTNPASLICGGECGPVCAGRVTCKVREQKQP